MPGRLRRCWSEWAKLELSTFVRSVILHGYRLQWTNGIPPPPMVRRNAPAVYDHPEFVTTKLAEVTENGVVRKCRREDLRCILPINVLPKPNSTKLRLILDGSPLVPYALKRKFKLEQIWKEGRELFAGCTHGSVIDISNAFFHIEIAEESKCFLGFEWRGEYYQFNNLPMGIHEAPFVFTEITKPVVRHRRTKGIRVLKNMDDFPSGAPSEQQQRLHARYMVEHLRSLGWLIQPSKLQGIPEPLERIHALGTLISFPDQKFYLAEDKLREIVDITTSLHTKTKCPVRSLSRLAGLLISRAHSLGPATRMRTRSMYQNIEARLKPHERGSSAGAIGWNRFVPLHATTRAELGFWLDNIQRLNGQPFLRAHINRVLDIDLNTDAGGRGWGAVLAIPPQGTVANAQLLDAVSLRLLPNMTVHAAASALRTGIKLCGSFTEAEQNEGSNVRELLATKYAFHALCPALAHLRMDHLVDNSGVAQALGGLLPADPDRIFGGSRNRRIQELVIEIDDLCIQFDIDRRTFWVPRQLNTVADYMAKLGAGDCYSYMLRPQCYALIERTFGQHSIDRFASRNNVQVGSRRYYSKFYEPEAEGLDAFSCQWAFASDGSLEKIGFTLLMHYSAKSFAISDKATHKPHSSLPNGRQHIGGRCWLRT